MEITKLILSLCSSTISGLFGYRIHKLLIALTWFIVGFLIGGSIAGAFLDTNLSIIIGCASGFVLGIVGYKLYLVGIFLLCGFVGFMICYTYIPMNPVNIIAGVVIGILVGFIGIKFAKPMMILSTSIGSGFMIANTVYEYFKVTNGILIIGTAILLSILACVFQFAQTKNIKN